MITVFLFYSFQTAVSIKAVVMFSNTTVVAVLCSLVLLASALPFHKTLLSSKATDDKKAESEGTCITDKDHAYTRGPEAFCVSHKLVIADGKPLRF